ncbi:MAG TPA: hypothetical protein VIG88_12610, partial [Lysobacter sp.]
MDAVEGGEVPGCADAPGLFVAHALRAGVAAGQAGAAALQRRAEQGQAVRGRPGREPGVEVAGDHGHGVAAAPVLGDAG